MKARMVQIAEDYPTLVNYWEGHGWPAIPEKFLPKTGVAIVDESDAILAAGFAYLDNSSCVAWMDWVVTNPRNRPTVSLVALGHLFEAIKEAIAALNDGQHGYGPLITACRQPSLVRLYEKHGFTVSDRDVTHLMLVLPQPEVIS